MGAVSGLMGGLTAGMGMTGLYAAAPTLFMDFVAGASWDMLVHGKSRDEAIASGLTNIAFGAVVDAASRPIMKALGRSARAVGGMAEATAPVSHRARVRTAGRNPQAGDFIHEDDAWRYARASGGGGEDVGRPWQYTTSAENRLPEWYDGYSRVDGAPLLGKRKSRPLNYEYRGRNYEFTDRYPIK
jgi:hypothetical protein